MPVVDTATQNDILDAWLGTTRAAGVPDDYRIRLWQDNPRTVGAAEADWGGYAFVLWDSDDWDAADGGEKTTNDLVAFAAPTGAGTDAARYWALHDSTTNELCYYAPLERPLNVTGAGSVVRIRPTIYFA